MRQRPWTDWKFLYRGVSAINVSTVHPLNEIAALQIVVGKRLAAEPYNDYPTQPLEEADNKHDQVDKKSIDVLVPIKPSIVGHLVVVVVGPFDDPLSNVSTES